MLLRSVGGRLIVAGCVVVGLAGVLAFAAGARYYVLHDGRFILTTSADVQIVGNQHVRRGQVLSVFGADLERDIFRVPLAQRRADLERLPWVEHATVMRLLPNHLRVAVTERTPVAFYRQGTQIGLVDASGVLLDMPPETAGDPHYSFPVLTGLSSDDTPTTRAARMEIYKRFLGDLDSGGQHLSQSISEVDVSNPEDIKALLASGGTDILVHFGDQDFLDRYRKFEAHLPEWKAQYPKLASADMRYDSQIVLEMLPGTGVPVNTSTAAVDSSGTTPAIAAGDAPAPSVESKSAVAAARHDVVAKPKTSPKATGSNARLFAALAAEHRAAVAKAREGSTTR
jgi:cell division protein FtsQ